MTTGAEMAARNTGIVIIDPANPSEAVKLAPTLASRPIGRTSVMTIENFPSIAESTTSHAINGYRIGKLGPPEGAVAVVVEAMNSIL